ncbi:MAG TPA: hypothetical protein VGI99_13065 [Gemmataceae bacterium]|jgi:hypothetical protein
MRLVIFFLSFLAISAAAAEPSPPPAPPLAQFEPLIAFPQPTQTAVRAVVLGINWMTRMNQPQGRFQFGFRPALRQPLEGDHDLKQARAALAMAQAARFTGNERQAAVASQAILALLAVTRIDAMEPNCRRPIVSSQTCNRTGFAAVLALAIYELPGADDKLVSEAERLCEFLHKQLRTDGSVHYIDSPNDSSVAIDPAGVNEYPGAALQAIAVSHRVKPAAWKNAAVVKGLEHYGTWFKAHPHPLLAASLTPAFAELFQQSKSNAAAAAVLEMNDWLAGLQYASGDARHPLWAGGFKSVAGGRLVESEPGCETGAYLQSLVCAYSVAAMKQDAARTARYKQSLGDAVQFLCGLQYTELNTRHFENTFRAGTLIGGFFFTPTDGNLRIDSTAVAITGLIRFLTSEAAKN